LICWFWLHTYKANEAKRGEPAEIKIGAFTPLNFFLQRYGSFTHSKHSVTWSKDRTVESNHSKLIGCLRFKFLQVKNGALVSVPLQ